MGLLGLLGLLPFVLLFVMAWRANVQYPAPGEPPRRRKAAWLSAFEWILIIVQCGVAGAVLAGLASLAVSYGYHAFDYHGHSRPVSDAERATVDRAQQLAAGSGFVLTLAVLLIVRGLISYIRRRTIRRVLRDDAQRVTWQDDPQTRPLPEGSHATVPTEGQPPKVGGSRRAIVLTILIAPFALAVVLVVLRPMDTYVHVVIHDSNGRNYGVAPEWIEAACSAEEKAIRGRGTSLGKSNFYGTLAYHGNVLLGPECVIRAVDPQSTEASMKTACRESRFFTDTCKRAEVRLYVPLRALGGADSPEHQR